MKCPFCTETGGRMTVHKHLIDEHQEEIQQTDKAEYQLGCPECDASTVLSTDAGTESMNGLQGFERDIMVMAFDKLLDHMADEHSY